MLLLQSSAPPLVAAITRLVEPWQSLYSEHTSVSTGLLFVHLAALVASAGLAVTHDRVIVATTLLADGERARRLDDLSSSHRSVVAALTVSFASGVLLLLADFEAFIGMPAFWVKMLLILLLIANALLMRRRESLLHADAARVQPGNPLATGKLWSGLRRSAWTSLTLWFAIVLAGTAMTTS